MNRSKLGILFEAVKQMPEWALAGFSVALAESVFPALALTASATSQECCRQVLDDLWSSLLGSTHQTSLPRHLETVKHLPESSEWDSHKPEYMAMLVIGVIYGAINVQLGRSRYWSLQSIISLTKQLCEDFDYDLDQIANGEKGSTEAEETEFALEICRTVQNAQMADPDLIAQLRWKSLRAADTIHTVVDKVGNLRGWPT